MFVLKILYTLQFFNLRSSTCIYLLHVVYLSLLKDFVCLLFVTFTSTNFFKRQNLPNYGISLGPWEIFSYRTFTLPNSCVVIDTTTLGEQSAGSSDSIWIVWMSLFILCLLLAIVAVMIIIYLAYLLRKRNKSKVDSNAGNDTLVQTNFVGKKPY